MTRHFTSFLENLERTLESEREGEKKLKSLDENEEEGDWMQLKDQNEDEILDWAL